MIKAEWTNKDTLDLQPTCNQLATDCISRQAAIEALCLECSGNCIPCGSFPCDEVQAIQQLPSAQHVMTYKEVAEIIADLFGDECACNYNGNDEWLPQSCKYAETECPSPKEKNGCWMQFLIQGGADMRGEQDDS